jgi:hypothetical protein
MPRHHAGRIPPNKGRRCPADPPSVDEIVAVMRQAGDGRHGRRMRGLIADRASLPTGPLVCVIDGQPVVVRGQPPRCAQSCATSPLRLGSAAGSRHTNFGMGALSGCSTGDSAAADPAPARACVPLDHRHLPGGISSEEIIGAVHRRRAPTMHASAGGAMFGCGFFGEAQRGVESLIRAGQHVPATS